MGSRTKPLDNLIHIFFSEKMHKVYVRSDAETYQLQLEEEATVGDLKAQIEEWTCCPPAKQVLDFLACPVLDDSLSIRDLLRPCASGSEGSTFHLTLPKAGAIKLRTDRDLTVLIGDKNNFSSKKITKSNDGFDRLNLKHKKLALIYHTENEQVEGERTFHVEVYKEKKDPEGKLRYELKCQKSEDGRLIDPIEECEPFENETFVENSNQFEGMISRVCGLIKYIREEAGDRWQDWNKTN